MNSVPTPDIVLRPAFTSSRVVSWPNPVVVYYRGDCLKTNHGRLVRTMGFSGKVTVWVSSAHFSSTHYSSANYSLLFTRRSPSWKRQVERIKTHRYLDYVPYRVWQGIPVTPNTFYLYTMSKSIYLVTRFLWLTPKIIEKEHF